MAVYSGMQAIRVRFAGPTDTRGARWIATADSGRLTASYDYAAPTGGAGAAPVAQALADKLGWTGQLIGGALPGPDSAYAFVFVPELDECTCQPMASRHLDDNPDCPRNH